MAIEEIITLDKIINRDVRLPKGLSIILGADQDKGGSVRKYGYGWDTHEDLLVLDETTKFCERVRFPEIKEESDTEETPYIPLVKILTGTVRLPKGVIIEYGEAEKSCGDRFQVKGDKTL